MKRPKWTEHKHSSGLVNFVGRSNFALPKGGFYLSFNPDNNETAIVVPDDSAIFDRAFYILDGDFRKDLESLTLQECLAFYDSHPEDHSSWSTY